MNHKMKAFIDLLWEMTLKELRIRYKNTTLGFLWAIVYPIVQAVIIGFVFRFLYRVPDPQYQYSLYANLLIWNFFSNSLENATHSIVQNRAIIKRAKFSYIVIPYSIILCNGIHLLFSLVLFTIFIGVFRVTSAIHIWSGAYGVMLLTALTLAISSITAALNVKNRDVNFLVHATLMIWFYATPIVYSMKAIPEASRYLWNFNPLTGVVMVFQNAFFGTSLSPMYLGIHALSTIIALFIGVYAFNFLSKNFDDFL